MKEEEIKVNPQRKEKARGMQMEAERDCTEEELQLCGTTVCCC